MSPNTVLSGPLAETMVATLKEGCDLSVRYKNLLGVVSRPVKDPSDY